MFRTQPNHASSSSFPSTDSSVVLLSSFVVSSTSSSSLITSSTFRFFEAGVLTTFLVGDPFGVFGVFGPFLAGVALGVAGGLTASPFSPILTIFLFLMA